MIGTAIIGTRDNGAPIEHIGHAHIAGQRHGRMRDGDAVAVEDFTIGGEATMELRSVPRGGAGGRIAFDFFGNIEFAGHGIGLAHHVIAAPFGDGFAVLNHFRTGFDAVFIAAFAFVRRICAIGECQSQQADTQNAAHEGKRPRRTSPHGARTHFCFVTGQAQILPDCSRSWQEQAIKHGLFDRATLSRSLTLWRENLAER